MPVIRGGVATGLRLADTAQVIGEFPGWACQLRRRFVNRELAGAADLGHQRVGMGRAFLKDVLKRTAQAADIAGIRALLVHAKDDQARQWYFYWEFEPSATDSFHLYLLRKDLKARIAGSF